MKYTDLCARLLDWEEYDEGKVNDAREEAAAAIRELEAERDQLADGKDSWKASSDEYERLFRNAKAKVAELTADYKTASDQADDLAAKLDAAEDKASKDAKAHEKEIAVWSENYAALEQKAAELTREREDAWAEALKEAADLVDAELMRWGFPSTDGCRRDQMRYAILALIPETKPQAAAIRKGGE